MPTRLKVALEIRKASDALFEESRKLSPPGGTIPVGGEHFSAHLKGEALANFLRGINSLAHSAEQARDYAKSEARQAIKIFNSRVEWQLYRADIHADSVIDWAYEMWTKAE